MCEECVPRRARLWRRLCCISSCRLSSLRRSARFSSDDDRWGPPLSAVGLLVVPRLGPGSVPWLLVSACSEVALGVVGSGVGGLEAGAGLRSWQREGGAPWWWRVALRRSLRIWRMVAMPRLGWLMPV